MIKIDKREELAKAMESGKCMIKISTPSCGPCRMVKGNMEKLEKEYSDVKFIDIDADECEEEILQDFSVRGVPVVVCCKDGKKIDKTVGLQTEDQLRERIDKLNQIQ